MVNVPNVTIQPGRLKLVGLLLFTLVFAMVLAISLVMFRSADTLSAVQSAEVQSSGGFVCRSGETQIMRYAGQETSLGCACKAGYSVQTENGPLGVVEWEVCK